jgi:hypothetical protein
MVRLFVGNLVQPAFAVIPYAIRPAGLELLDRAEADAFFRQLRAVSMEALAPPSVAAYWNAAIDAIPLEQWYASCTGMDHTLERMRQRDPVGLARMRTRLTSPAHYEFMAAGISRVLAGEHGASHPERVARVREWNA